MTRWIRAAASAVAVIGAATLTAPVVAAQPVGSEEGYVVRLDPLTTKLFATDQAGALAEAVWATPLPDGFLLGSNLLWANRIAQVAARYPAGCVEMHIRLDRTSSYSSGVGSAIENCQLLVPSVAREEPTKGGWSRG